MDDGWPTSGVISRGNAWERRSHCWKAAGTHGNGVPSVKVKKNAQERNAAVKKDKETFCSVINAHLHFTFTFTSDKTISANNTGSLLLTLKVPKSSVHWNDYQLYLLWFTIWLNHAKNVVQLQSWFFFTMVQSYGQPWLTIWLAIWQNHTQKPLYFYNIFFTAQCTLVQSAVLRSHVVRL